MGTGGEGEAPPPASSQAGSSQRSVAVALLFIEPETLTYHFQRNKPQECVYMANPSLSRAGAKDTGCSCHTSAAHPVLETHLEPAMPGPKCLCVGQKLHPEPPPQQGICPGCQAQPTPHRAIPRPDLIFPPAALPCSFLSSVRFVSFPEGGDVTAPWTLPFCQPRPA